MRADRLEDGGQVRRADHSLFINQSHSIYNMPSISMSSIYNISAYHYNNINTNTYKNRLMEMDRQVWIYVLVQPILMLVYVHMLLLFSHSAVFNAIAIGVLTLLFVVYAIRAYSALHHEPVIAESTPEIDVERVFEARRVS